MTDASAGEMPPDPAAPVPPEIPPDASAAPEVETPVSVELDAASVSAAAPAERALPFDVDHLGPLRRAVLDALVDADEPLSVSRILAEMPPGTTRGSAESAIKREYDAGRIERSRRWYVRVGQAKAA
jgi:hypothetical protein